MSFSINGAKGFSLGNINKINTNVSDTKFHVNEANSISNVSNYNINNSNNVENMNLSNSSNGTETLDLNSSVTLNSSKSPAGIDYNQLKKDGYTAQGYTTYGDKVLITGYSKAGEKSRIYIYDNNTGNLSNVIILDNKSHVGGMSVDKNGILFVTKSGGKIETYNLKDLQKDFGNEKTIDFSDEKYAKYKIKNDINTGESEATLYCYDGKVYTATYSSVGTLKEITYSFENGMIKSNTRVISNDIASNIQGLSIYKDNKGKEYLVVASSSEHIGSRIRIYEKNGDHLKRIVSCNSKMEGLEGIKIDNKGNITGICEFGKQSVRDLGSVNDYIDRIKKSHVSLINNDFLFTIAGLVWDLQHADISKIIKA
ncbi:MAG: hypothetical protein VZS44_03580 [Bacilli bacterium]|nr:hypothetical protein [Bacilli bacterium]